MIKQHSLGETLWEESLCNRAECHTLSKAYDSWVQWNEFSYGVHAICDKGWVTIGSSLWISIVMIYFAVCRVLCIDLLIFHHFFVKIKMSPAESWWGFWFLGYLEEVKKYSHRILYGECRGVLFFLYPFSFLVMEQKYDPKAA